jgi:hypothetical protein
MSTKPLAPNEIEFDVWTGTKWAPVRRRGRLCTINNSATRVAVFGVSVMAAAISRDERTLRRWEKAGLWPTPMWRIEGARRKTRKGDVPLRWYSADQIRAIHKKHQELAQGRHGFAHSRHFPMRAYLQWVREHFYRIDVDANPPDDTQSTGLSAWEQIDQAAKPGKRVVVRITPVERPTSPFPRAGGRPRVRDAAQPFAHYKGADPGRPGHRPRCQARRCHKLLRRDQALACCEDHHRRVVEHAQELMERVRRTE